MCLWNTTFHPIALHHKTFELPKHLNVHSFWKQERVLFSKHVSSLPSLLFKTLHQNFWIQNFFHLLCRFGLDWRFSLRLIFVSRSLNGRMDFINVSNYNNNHCTVLLASPMYQDTGSGIKNKGYGAVSCSTLLDKWTKSRRGNKSKSLQPGEWGCT